MSMTNHGPFDAAIECLKNDGDGDLWFHGAEKAAAIAVLKAAAKVSEREIGRIHMGFISSEMRDLLEAIRLALPDATKGGDK